MRAILLAVLMMAPLVAAQDDAPAWESRDTGFSPRGSGVADVWWPRTLVQGETALFMVTEFHDAHARVEVAAPDGSVAFAKEIDMQSYGTGHYGEVRWEVPANATPGAYRATASSARDGPFSTSIPVYAAPHLYASHAPLLDGIEELDVEAVGFDDGPVHATVAQGPMRWSADFAVGRGEARTVGKPVNATVPGADDARMALRAHDGSQSVIVSPRLFGAPGDPIVVWFNGTVAGAPRSADLRWRVPARPEAAMLVAPDSVAENDTMEVLLAGLANASVTLGSLTRAVEPREGFAQLVLPASAIGGADAVANLTVTGTTLGGEAFAQSQLVRVAPRPVPEPEIGARVPGAPLGAILAALMIVASLRKR